MATPRDIILGSGILYLKKFTDGSEFNMADVIQDENILGYIKNGCKFSYTKNTSSYYDDMKFVRKSFITDEEVKLTSGLITWNLETLNHILTNQTYSEDDGKRTFVLGGSTRELDTIAAVFVHERGDGKQIRVGMVATNDGSLELNFLPDEPTVVDAVLTAVPLPGTSGNLVIIEEDI